MMSEQDHLGWRPRSMGSPFEVSVDINRIAYDAAARAETQSSIRALGTRNRGNYDYRGSALDQLMRQANGYANPNHHVLLPAQNAPRMFALQALRNHPYGPSSNPFVTPGELEEGGRLSDDIGMVDLDEYGIARAGPRSYVSGQASSLDQADRSLLPAATRGEQGTALAAEERGNWFIQFLNKPVYRVSEGNPCTWGSIIVVLAFILAVVVTAVLVMHYRGKEVVHDLEDGNDS